METSYESVQEFLESFKAKALIYPIVFRDDRGKNFQSNLNFEITHEQRTREVLQLVAEDYAQGPNEEKLYKGAEMWVFGKMVKGKEYYIKISLGVFNDSPLCISFHPSEWPLTYAFRN